MLGIKSKDAFLNFVKPGFAAPSQSILDVFVLQNIIDPEDAEALRSKFKTNREIEDYLLQKRLVTRDTINKAYSIILKLPFIELSNTVIPAEGKALISDKMARRFHIIPFGFEENTLKLAVSRPAELLVGYQYGLTKIFEGTNYNLEIFITGDDDFENSFKQYDKNFKGFLLKKGSLPVVYLRNQKISDAYLKKLPLDFVKKYRMVIFGQNNLGEYQLASEKPDDPMTLKNLDYLKSQNNISLELFATSKEDIDYSIDLFNGKSKPSIIDGIKDKIVGLENQSQDKKPVDFWGESDSEFSVNRFPEIVDSKNTPDSENIQPESLKIKIEDENLPLTKQKDDAATESVSIDNHPVEDPPVIEEVGTEPEENITSNKDDDIAIGLMDERVIEEKDLTPIISEGYVPKILSAILNYAINKRSSDVHLEPETKLLRVRCRIDGLLRDIAKLPLKLHPPLISRIKVLSKLKLDESRIPQDGRFEMNFKNHSVDFRISTLPTVHGEKAVIRILDKDQTILSLEDLGMEGSAFEKTLKAISKPFGTILSTGPTGSGKSTTLYAILNRISVPGINIVTLEDPVEYDIPGINQCQIKPEIGFTFANGLRSVLRQDPNIIMVGEVRDAETANMVTHASLTGHLVLSTLHTNDSASALPRLINMGVEPFLITSSINIVIGQRLVRRICPKCREEMKIPTKLADRLKQEIDQIASSKSPDVTRLPSEIKLYYGKGCSECHQGYRGRIGIFEVLSMTEAIEDLAVARRPSNEIKDTALSEGMITMKQDGIIKALHGLTTIDEIYQAVITS